MSTTPEQVAKSPAEERTATRPGGAADASVPSRGGSANGSGDCGGGPAATGQRIGRSVAAGRTQETAESVWRVVGEIKSRLREMVARETEMRRREQELAAIQGRVAGPESRPAPPPNPEADKQLAELRQRAAALAEKETQLEQTQARLAAREGSLRAREAALAQAIAGHRQRQDEYESRQQRRRTILARRIQRVRECERGLLAALEAERAGVVEGRAAIDHAWAEITEIRQELAQRQSAIEQQADQCARTLEELQRVAERHAAERAELASARQAIEQQRGELTRIRAEQAGRMQELDERQAAVTRAMEQLRSESARRETELRELEVARARLEQEKLAFRSAKEEHLRLKRECEEREAACRRAADELRRQATQRRTETAELEKLRAAVEQRQAAAARQQQELEARRRQIETAETDLERGRKELEARRRLLEDERSQSAGRLAALDQQRQQVAAQLEGLAADRSRLERADAALEQRRGELEALREKLAAEQQEVFAARARVEATESGLGERRAELDRLAAECEARRRELEGLAAELRTEESFAEQRRSELDARQRELEASQARVAAEQSAVEQRRAEVAREAERLEQDRAELARSREDLAAREQGFARECEALEEARAEIDQARSDLAAREVRMQEHERQAEELKRELARQKQELDARRQLLDEQQLMLDMNAERLRVRERELREQAESLREDRRRLEQIEAELARQRESAEQARDQAAAAEARTGERFAELEALTARLSAREQELAQHAHYLELDAERCYNERRLLESEREKLAALREMGERELAQVRIALERGGLSKLDDSLPELMPARPRWGRMTAFAAAAAILAAAGVWHLDAPRFRSAAQLRIEGQDGPAAVISAEHAARIAQADTVEGLLAPQALDGAWRSARSSGRLQIIPATDETVVDLALVSDQEGREAGRRLVVAAAEAYAKQGLVLASRARDAWRAAAEAQRAHIVNELAHLRQAQSRRQSELEALPAGGAWADAVTQLEDARSRLGAVSDELRRQREELLAVRSHDLPRGSVSEEDAAAALSADAIFQADREEFESVSRSYQTELALAMIGVIEPAKQVRTAAQSLHATLQEQIDLRPPPAVSATLEECISRVASFDEQMAAFSVAWDAARADVERAAAGASIAQLVEAQSRGFAECQVLLTSAQGLLSDLRARVDKLGEEGGGTREIVVSSVLRGDLTNLEQAVLGMSESAAQMDTATNFRLDAVDRQVRGLRTRLSEREQFVRAGLQERADRAAADAHAAMMRDLIEQTGGLEQERDELLAALIEQTESLQALGTAMPRRVGLGGEIERDQQEIRRLEQELARIEATLQQAESGAATQGRIAVNLLPEQRISGVYRERNTAAGGLAAFLVAWLGCWLVTARIRRARAAALQPALELPAPAKPATSDVAL